MVRSARLEPLATGTTLSPVAVLRDGALILRLPHPSRRAATQVGFSRLAHYCKPISGKPEIGGRAPQDEADRRTRLPQDEDERVGWPVCCKQQRIYKAPLMQTPDAFRRRAQFQLWIFSYHIFAHSPKKSLSRVLLVRRATAANGATAPLSKSHAHPPPSPASAP